MKLNNKKNIMLPQSNALPIFHPQLEVMNFLNEINLKYPHAISFVSGRPADEFCFIEKIPAWLDLFCKKIKPNIKQKLLGQYGPTSGIICDLITKSLKIDENIDLTPSDIVITSGGQEAMIIPLLSIFDPTKDVLLVTNPCFMGITNAAKLLNIELEAIPISLQTDYKIQYFEQAIENVKSRGKNPKAIYVIPDFNNPLGNCMSYACRKQLVKLANQHDILIFEDNPYSKFRYNGKKIPTIKALDQSQSVIYMETFSKTLFPGLRIGFIASDQFILVNSKKQKLTDLLSKAKSNLTVNTSPINQAILGGVLYECGFSLIQYNQSKIMFYKKQRDLMLSCLQKTFRGKGKLKSYDKITWNSPDGGFFLVVDLPFAITNDLLYKAVKSYGVIVLPVQYFSIIPGYENQIRLAFSNVSQENIKIGIKRLESFIHDILKEQSI